MKKLLLLMVVALVLLWPAGAQEISERKEIAVFALNYYDWSIPQGALGLVDSQISDVFVNIGRFDVIGMTYRLDAGDVNAFIAEIRKYKQENVEIPQEVRLGEVTFTEADFNRLTGSFIVVIPVLAGYSNNQVDGDSWEAVLNTSFSFVNVETLKTFAFVNVETTGTGANPQEALRNAADYIAPRLEFEVRSIPEFTLKTGVVEVLPFDTILLQFGRNMGVQKGDEFALIRSRVLPTGHQLEEEQGLIKIKDVTEELSYGYVLYSQGRPMVGEQLKEVPRLGVDTSLYLQTLSSAGSLEAVMLGLRGALSRGFFRYRPIIGFEVPFGSSIGKLWGLPFNSYVGTELSWYFKRLAIRPMGALGIGGIIPIWELEEESPEDFILTHVGGLIDLQASYLLTRDLRVFGSLGMAYWLGVADNIALLDSLLGSSYGGVSLSLGITYKL